MAGAEKSRGEVWGTTGKLLLRLLLRGRSEGTRRVVNSEVACFTITICRLTLAALLTTHGERAQK